jgi:hypothetical protein
MYENTYISNTRKICVVFFFARFTLLETREEIFVG